jgi:hypothetical protein
MKRKIFGSAVPVILVAAALSLGALAVSLLQQRGAAKSPTANQTKQKPLKERAKERDVSIEMKAGSQFTTFDELLKLPHAIVYGRIIDSVSFFDESGDNYDQGEYITTEYAVEVNQVLKETKLNTPLEPGQPAPVPLVSPLKIARNGGVVNVNGHRAEVKVKGYEFLKQGQQYVFFLFWSTDYNAYIFAGEISGVVLVNDDLSLKSFASSEEIREKLRGINLESLSAEISRRN